MIKTLALLAFVLLTACHGGPKVTAIKVTPFPALPDTIYTASGAIPVVLVDSIHVDSTGFSIGRFHFFERRIYVVRSMVDPKYRRKTVEHERCHAILIESGLARHATQWFTELLCDAFAVAAVNQIERGQTP